jgi:paraquat-inducible protein B
MAEERETPTPAAEARGPEAPPAAVVEAKSRFSFVWLVPIVAALIGAWLAYTAFSERGPEITITFESGEGLAAGKTKVKYKDIEVGMVQSVELADDLSHVVVTAELASGAERYLTHNTRFWVERARISAGQVSGLGTVFSGAYIGMDPVREGERERHFTGLEVPPVVTRDEPGRHFTLRSETLGSVEVGVPVLYRSIRVGQVVAYELDESGDFVTAEVFVKSPHDQRVRDNTRFWNASGLDISLSAQGIQVDTTSVVSMLIGGVAFDTPENLEPGREVDDDHVFYMYPNRQASLEQTYALKRRFLLYFGGSVDGLVPGSSVVFRGIELGKVLDVRLQFDPEALEFEIPVLIEIEPERIEFTDVPTDEPDDRAAGLVKRGLRAQLGRGNLLTGQLQVVLDIHPDAPPAELRFEGSYAVIPTVPTPLEEITTSVAHILDRIEKVPLEQIGEDLHESLVALRATLDETRGVSKQLNEELAPTLGATLAQLEEAAGSTNAMLSPDSPMRREMQRSLTELAEAARSMRLLLEYLEQHPESLLRGKEVQ